jgi:hypothetical protein
MTSILMQTWSTQMSEHAHVDGVYPFPAVMQTRTIETNGTSIHVRVGGHGPTVVMLHGFGTTGDMWGHLASARNIKGAHFAVGCGYSYHHLPKGAPL